MEIVRLGHGVDRTGVIAPEAHGAHPRRWPASTPRSAASSGPSGCASWRPRRPGTPRNADEFVDGVRAAFSALRHRAGGRHRRRGGRAVVHAAPRASCGARRRPAPTSWSTSAAARPSSSAAPTHVEAARSVDIGCVRMTERHLHSRPARRPPRSRPRPRDIDAALDLAAAGGRRRGRRGPGRAGRHASPPITAHALRLTAYDPDAHPPAALPVPTRSSRPATDLLAHDPRRAGGPAVHAPRPGRRHRRRGAGLAPRSSSGCAARPAWRRS